MQNNPQYQSGINLAAIDHRLRATVLGEDIRLEPLTKGHAPAYFSQYCSTGIQEMTDLPVLASVSDVYKWIEEEAEIKNSYNYAIVLPVTGFAGFVNLIISEYACFFTIWLGQKFQGLGLGTQTGRLICHHALQGGLSVIFTAAFLTNNRSIQMLKKVGFETLPINAYAPHHDRGFFILTKDPAIKLNGNNELINYYQREDLPHRFYPSNSY